MYHGVGDGNGASCSFFTPLWDPSLSNTDRAENPVLSRMNRRFSLFAYLLDDEGDVLRTLKAGDVLEEVEVLPGEWKLQQQTVPVTP